MRNLLKKILNSPGLAALTGFGISVVIIDALAVLMSTPVFDSWLIVAVLPALIMLAALVYQIRGRKWLRAFACLALGIVVLVSIPVMSGFASLYQNSRQPWEWDSTKTTLPNGIGTITLQTRSADPPDFLPTPGSERQWRVIIDTPKHKPSTIMLGEMIDHSENLRVWIIEQGGTKILRFNIVGKDFYFDLMHGKTTDKVRQPGTKLGNFYDDEFIPETAPRPKANGGLFHPIAVAAAQDGSVYVADSSTRLMVKYTEDGRYITKWHIGKDFDTDRCGTLRCNITVDSKGSVWVIDWDSELLKYSADGRLLKIFGSTDFTLPDATPQFSEPWGVAVDKDGYVYITQRNGHVQKVSTEGKTILKWGEGSDGNFIPAGISVTSDGHLLVANQSSGIETYSLTGKQITNRSIGTGSLLESRNPVDVKTDELGNVYVAKRDGSGLLIEKYTAKGQFLLKWNPGVSLPDFGPGSIAVGQGFVYVADENNHRVLKFTDNGKLIEGWGR